MARSRRAGHRNADLPAEPASPAGLHFSVLTIVQVTAIQRGEHSGQPTAAQVLGDGHGYRAVGVDDQRVQRLGAAESGEPGQPVILCAER